MRHVPVGASNPKAAQWSNEEQVKSVLGVCGSMQSSNYRHRTSVDEASGRFDYDCSGFIDYALQKISPEAYAEIPVSKASSKRPLAQDFYSLFSHPPQQASHWERIRKIRHVQAGDLVAWLRPIDRDSTNTGHVMVASAKPTINPEQADERLISVIDFTTSPHAQDSRRDGQTGLGTGIIGVIVNSKDERSPITGEVGNPSVQRKLLLPLESFAKPEDYITLEWT